VASASFRSVAEMFLHRVASTPDSDALTFPTDEGWRTINWQEAGDRARHIASGLAALGLRAEERCAILSSTRVEWILADMGIVTAGCATTTVYPASSVEECAHVLADSDSRVVFTEDAGHTARLRALRDSIPGVTRIVQFQAGGEATHDLDPDSPKPWVVTLAALEKLGRAASKEHPDAWEARARAVRPDHLATLIYTSGTTGVPKGVELTHDCWVFEGEAMDALGIMSPADKQYLFLPLAHAFAKVLEIATIRIGITTVVDGRADALLDNLALTRPTFMGGVPRIFEKAHNRIIRQAREGGPLQRRVFEQAMATGAEMSRIRQAGRRPSRALLLRYALADRLVFSRVKERFGGRLRFFVSGAAPLPRSIAEFFHASGILMLEGYGLTESGAASFVNRPERYRFGTVGPPMPGVQVRLDPADGEILIQSRGVMRGYHGLPDETAAVLDSQGWLRTGDIGVLDSDGFLSITDRKKDLIKTSSGKYVAPQAIESRLKAQGPWISHALVHGDNRNFVTALLALDEEHLRAWAQQRGLGDLDTAALSRHHDVLAELQVLVDRSNASLANHEQIRHFAVLPRDLSVEAGELTPSLKVKRRAVEEHYRALLDGFYQDTIAELSAR